MRNLPSVLTVQLVSLGNLKCRLDYRLIERWSSHIFMVVTNREAETLPPMKDDLTCYSDSQLEPRINSPTTNGFTVALINAPLQYSHYSRRLRDNKIVVSLDGIVDVLIQEHLKIELFIISQIYKHCIYFYVYDHRIPNSEEFYKLPRSEWRIGPHDDTRGCLFDMHWNKNDVRFSMDPPCLCKYCVASIANFPVPEKFAITIQTELKRVRKQLYYRALDFIRDHPLISIVITALFGISLNIIASFLYDYLVKSA